MISGLSAWSASFPLELHKKYGKYVTPLYVGPKIEYVRRFIDLFDVFVIHFGPREQHRYYLEETDQRAHTAFSKINTISENDTF